MRIIKEEYHDEMARKIQPAQFMVFPEEWLVTAPKLDDDGEHEGGNGKDDVVIADPVPAFDFTAAKQEADQLIEHARREAEQSIAQAEEQGRQIIANGEAHAQQLIAKTQSDCENASKEAYAAGFSSGEEAGYRKGYEDGYTKGKAASVDEAARSLSMITRAVQALENYHGQVLSEAQQDIVKMALSVAEKVLHKEIMTDPNTVVSVVKNAISRVGFKRHFTVFVNPLDLEVLQAAGQEVASMVDSMESVKFKPDPKVEAGGCIIQTESGIIDAQVDRQFGEIKTSVMNAMAQG